MKDLHLDLDLSRYKKQGTGLLAILGAVAFFFLGVDRYLNFLFEGSGGADGMLNFITAVFYVIAIVVALCMAIFVAPIFVKVYEVVNHRSTYHLIVKEDGISYKSPLDIQTTNFKYSDIGYSKFDLDDVQGTVVLEVNRKNGFLTFLLGKKSLKLFLFRQEFDQFKMHVTKKSEAPLDLVQEAAVLKGVG